MTRSWIADTSDEVEHPPIPLGLNEMAVPRAAILLSLGTAVVILISVIWLGFAAWEFQKELTNTFGAADETLLKDGDRWNWEVDLLFDTCDSRLGDWDWPEVLAEQDEKFLYPGELRCDWEHQGNYDRASLVIYNRGNATLDLVLEIVGGSVEFADEEDSNMLVNGLLGNETIIIELLLLDDVTEHDFTITATHVAVQDAIVTLDVHLFKGTEEETIHASDGDRLEVHYKVWDADTDELLDEGDLLVTAGDDSNYIKGFGWSAIGLDIGDDRGLLNPGTTHTTLLPPPIAYGNSDGHQLQNSWLKFELRVDRALA